MVNPSCVSTALPSEFAKDRARQSPRQLSEQLGKLLSELSGRLLSGLPPELLAGQSAELPEEQQSPQLPRELVQFPSE
ncbi:hypothetical protein FJY68_14165 [candidate division WOR-3 bacterium]|uniref:Uncharacterized protein n=1 Tax=candidate division WOR-3 bacterium TaxID=2052148 RepID=A0A938BUS4_UNCW3|nr:hypothetical protein [candidate division WOR-3 bacterium]